MSNFKRGVRSQESGELNYPYSLPSPNNSNPNQIKVELRAAKIPYIGAIAVHYWFIIYAQEVERWEIWQNKSLISSSWGHLHKNLMNPIQGVGNGHSWVENIWQGEEAHNLQLIIRKTPEIYPYNYLYRYYPGPNSNTYVQWILDQAKISYSLSRKGLGKNYHRLFY